MSVRIVTDSACDLPQSLADELGIAIVPLTIRIDGTDYVDRRDLTPSEFWIKADAAAELPSTAAPAPGQFTAAYSTLVDDGATSIVAVCLSSALSATMQAAALGARAFDAARVSVVDGRTVSLAQGMIVADCARLAATGADHDTVVARADALVASAKLWG